MASAILADMHRGGNLLLWTLLILRLPLGPSAAAQPSKTAKLAQPAPATDKALHLLGGASCALLVSAVAASALRDSSQPDLQYALCVSGAGLGAAVAAGAAKELLDLAGFGNPQWSDLLATVAGGLAVSAVVFAASAADRQARLAPVYASFGIALAFPPAADLLTRRFSRRASRSGS
jgi:hypothetical protein